MPKTSHKAKKPYQYGDPAPKDWGACADALLSLKKRSPSKKGNPLLDRLTSIEQRMKDSK